MRNRLVNVNLQNSYFVFQMNKADKNYDVTRNPEAI